LAGIYLHIPFCKQACHYCNFHFSTSLQQKEAVLSAMLKEIELTDIPGDPNISSIYFGGGTPSMLTTDDLQRLFDALHKKFNVEAGAEITLEANPDDIENGKLKQWHNMGVNRLSLGIQSFLEEELRWMNRAHTAVESLACIDKIRDEGFTNFSVDLIYGSPLLSNDDWLRNIDTVTEKAIPHISCYALTVEPATALQKMISLQKKADVDPGRQAEQFLLLMNRMQSAGYEHYEISNYALPGMHSHHNSSYWQGAPYYGFGPSAHSFDGNTRKWNVANNALYIQSLKHNHIPFEEELLTPTQQLNEYIMTSLRTSEGLNLGFVEKKFGVDKAGMTRRGLNKWEKENKVMVENEKAVLTKEGKLFADGIAADLFF